MTSRFAALVLAAVAAATNRGCSCQPSEQCQLVRALCKLDLCRKTDTAGWAYCNSQPDTCDPIEGACTTRSECLTVFMDRCSERMVPGAFGYDDYARCATLDCSAGPAAPPPPPPSVPDASVSPDAETVVPDAGAPPFCAGVLCDGACCTAYPCFANGRCTCVASVSACKAPGGGDAPPFSPTCCSDAPLCSAQNKVCCFIPASGGLPAQTRCLADCAGEQHCVSAPFRNEDGSSCLGHSDAQPPCPF